MLEYWSGSAADPRVDPSADPPPGGPLADPPAASHADPHPDPHPDPRVDLHVEVDTVDGRRVGLERALRAAIRDGRLVPGAPLPSTRGLAGRLGFARGTVTAAYDQLVAEGYLTARPGAVTRVADVPRPAPTTPASASPAAATVPRFDLRPGLPDGSAFPAAAWLRSTRRVLSGAPAAIHGVGDPQGRIELRTALADHLGRTRGVLTTPDRIVITSGFYQSVGLLAAVLGDAGVHAVGMEDPGHDVYRDVVRRAGRTVVPLPVDTDGARFERLADRGVGAVVVTPAHQYPTGVPLLPRRRHELCGWARETGGLIVEDDYDGEFRYDRQPVGALQGMAPEHVAYCGSVSKTLGPGLRLAWLALPRRLVEPVVTAKLRADFHTHTLGQLVLADLIVRHDYDRHVRAARLSYRRRREHLVGRFAAERALGAYGFQGVPAGLHVLVTLPADGPTEPDLLATCAERGIALRGTRELWHGTPRRQGLLVGFAAPAEHAWPATLDALAAVLREG
ncbi:PLP-dependent aminotransferase family protein [Embleya sp. NBC_00896]|uniref:MocR-like pyridoxine biosynthesis transcription factor PdxR n=1 Tax=Embleya sp. NBC_00896 TaxID=2975961 RepID=UPI002F9193F7|nr:PLP-dependent aminotransferase family protein [Embleya sp. NBC_00896]